MKSVVILVGLTLVLKCSAARRIPINVAINKIVTASSTFTFLPGWNEWDNIVDGDIIRDGNTCYCCAATRTEADPWITVDLELHYWIENVVVYGRNDHNSTQGQNLVGLQLHFTKTSGLQGDGIYTVKGDGWIDFVNVTIEQQLGSRYVTLLLKGDSSQLPVCELEVYGSVCENGTYGNNCQWACGHCYRDQPCNYVDGTCNRCDLGYLGELCETECIPGTYGQDCSTLCGVCSKYETCNHVTGLCSNGCAEGRQGDICKQECGNYTFGVNCRQQCHCGVGKSCDSIHGDCEDGLCAEGFFGDDCQQINACPDESDGNIQGMLIGVVSGVACIIIVLVVAGVCFLKRRKRDDKSSRKVTNPTYEHEYEDLHTHLSQL